MAGVVSDDGSPSSKSKIKFMCSHGGKILPRPSDGQLKYVGGETRVIAVPRSITFSELMRKLSSLFEGDLILKYQLMPEDLDALVSVTCDEDLKHMVDEYDHHDFKLSGNVSGPPRLRAFLFPSNQVLVDGLANNGETTVLEQRYIDAINGFVRSSGGVGRSNFTISSSGFQTPNTPDSYCTDTAGNRDIPAAYISSSGDAPTPALDSGGRLRSVESGMGRVHSSPNMLGIPHQGNHHLPPQSRLARPAALQSTRSDAGRYPSGQMGRRYCVGVGYPGGNGGYVGYANMESSGRGGGSGGGEGDVYLPTPSNHRLG